MKVSIRVLPLLLIAFIMLFSLAFMPAPAASPHALRQAPLVLPEAALTIVIGMMVLSNRLVAVLVTPIFDRAKWDKFYLMYVAWLFAGILTALTQVNIFAGVIPSPIAGLVLTALFAGGGANIFYDLSDKPTQTTNVFYGPPVPVQGELLEYRSADPSKPPMDPTEIG